MNNLFGDTKIGKSLNFLSSLIGVGVAIATFTWLFINIFGIDNRTKMYARLKSNEYVLPFEIGQMVRTFNDSDIDSLLLSIINQNKVKNFKLYDSSFRATKKMIIDKFKFNYLDSVERWVHYSNVLTLTNNGRRIINNIKISSNYLNNGYYQYFDNNNKPIWGTFKNSITIQSIEAKSSIMITFLSMNEISTNFNDIKIAYPDNIIYPKLLHNVKGLLGLLLSDTHGTFLLIIIISFIGIFIGLIILLFK